MAQIECDHGRKIAFRQSPFFIILGVVTIIGGCILMARSGYYLYGMYSHRTELSGIAAISMSRSLVYLCVQLVRACQEITLTYRDGCAIMHVWISTLH